MRKGWVFFCPVSLSGEVGVGGRVFEICFKKEKERYIMLNPNSERASSVSYGQWQYWVVCLVVIDIVSLFLCSAILYNIRLSLMWGVPGRKRVPLVPYVVFIIIIIIF